jgi:hypothetical protein
MVRRLLDIFTFIYYLWRGAIHMVDMYLALVIAGRRTCDPTNTEIVLVPKKYRDAVLVELKALGLDANGDPIV